MYFRNSHVQGNADLQFYFGDPGDRFVAGEWSADGRSSPGVFRPSTQTLYVRFTNTPGNADAVVGGASPALIPVAGFLGNLP
jgi:hypothetical protein